MANHCTSCGAPLTGSRHCTACGALTSRAGPPPHRPSAGARLGLSGAIAAVTLATMLLAVAAYRILDDDDRALPSAGGTTEFTPATDDSHPADLAPSVPPTTEPPQSRTSSAPAIVTEGDLDKVAGLDTGAAVALLNDRVDAHRPLLTGLAWTWSPQVSSKCRGLDVDLGPHWFPDGVMDTTDVNAAQILAFHLYLEQRFGALTTTADDLGVDTRAGACAGLPIWVSVVPLGFTTAEDVLVWCDQNAFPEGECGARYVVPLGSPGTRLVL